MSVPSDSVTLQHPDLKWTIWLLFQSSKWLENPQTPGNSQMPVSPCSHSPGQRFPCRAGSPNLFKRSPPFCMGHLVKWGFSVSQGLERDEEAGVLWASPARRALASLTRAPWLAVYSGGYSHPLSGKKASKHQVWGWRVRCFCSSCWSRKPGQKGQALAFFWNYLTGLLSLYSDGVTARKSSFVWGLWLDVMGHTHELLLQCPGAV